MSINLQNLLCNKKVWEFILFLFSFYNQFAFNNFKDVTYYAR